MTVTLSGAQYLTATRGEHNCFNTEAPAFTPVAMIDDLQWQNLYSCRGGNSSAEVKPLLKQG